MNLAHRAIAVDPPARRRRSRERGATLVEFAFVAPLLFLLVFSIIDFGLTLNDYQSIRQGVREGAREGSVKYFSDYDCQTTLAGAGTARQIQCAVENRTNIGSNATYVKTVLLSTGLTPWDKGEYILVCAQAKATSFTGFTAPVLSNLWLKSKIRIRLEKDGGSGTGLQESVPAGTNWGWCT